MAGPRRRRKDPGREISRNARVFDAPSTDKIHPHDVCSVADLLALFSGVECLKLDDREHETPGFWHWHLTMEKLG